MILIFGSDRAHARSYEDFDDLFRHISDQEKLKFQENHQKFGQTFWSFTLFTPQWVSAIYNNTQPSLLTETVKEAYEKEVGFIEICQGNLENPLEVLVTPDLDIEALKKFWCLEYCKTHEYIVVESLSNSWTLEHPQWWYETFNSFEKPSELLPDNFMDDPDENLYQTVCSDLKVNIAFQESLIGYPLSVH